MNRDTLLINQLQLTCHIGTTLEERTSSQSILVSIRCELSLMKAGRSDDFNDAVDYAQIVEELREISRSKTFHLIEALAETIAQQVLLHSHIDAVDVTVEKKPFPDVQSVAAHIYRTK